jgi:hypothetical protein|nr:domain containing protein [Aeromicrobium sp.]
MRNRWLRAVPAGVVLAVAASLMTASPSAAAGGRVLTLVMNSGVDTSFVRGETVWLGGTLASSSGRRISGRTVVVHRVTSKGRTRVDSRTTGRNGSYRFALRARSGATYVASVGTLRSKKLTLKRVTTRSLEQREASLASELGGATSGVESHDGARWRSYRRGMLVERGGVTWLVRARAWREYRDQGGPARSLGAPTRDARCDLLEGGCLQHFTNGAIYTNPKARDTAVSQEGPDNRLAGLVAVARSQVGYREPGYRKSKYNRWMGRTGPNDPWCGYFVSWLSHASGDGRAIVRATTFPAQIRAEKARKRITSKPAIGRLAYIDLFNDGRTKHIGIVSKFDDKHVWIVEGNVDAKGKSSLPRGVHVVKRSRERVNYYATPRF